MKERLQKIIAAAGLTSRRKAEDLILSGSVTINGKIATRLGTKADPIRDHIKVSGRLIRSGTARVYLMLHKPRGIVSTLSDPEKRKTVKDLIRRVPHRVFPVGRLDYDSEGLMLLTNDGELFQRLLHPASHVSKKYQVKVKGALDEDEISRLEKGITVSGKVTLPCRIRTISRSRINSWIEITLHEGRKRQIRRMLLRIGHRVLKLKRIQIANLELGKLPPGEFRYLTAAEIKGLKRAGERAAAKTGRRTGKAVGE